MKMFRWLAAGVLVILLAALVLWKTGHVRPSQSLSQPATPAPSNQAAASAKPGAVGGTSTSVPAETASIRSDATAFETWVLQYANAGAAERVVLLAQGEALAQARRAEMAELIRNDPEEAIAQALPYALRKQLPESIRNSIEQPVSGRGDFRPVCYTPTHGNPNHVHRMGYEVVMNKTRFTTFTYGERLHQPRQESAYLHGVSVPASEPNEKAQPEILLALSPDPVRLPSEEEVIDLAQAGEIKPDAICGTCGKPASSAGHATVGQFGNDYYSFCTLAHALQFNHQLQSAHGLIWGSAGGSAGNPPDQLPPTAFSGTQGIKKLLYIRVLFSDDPTSPESDNAAQATVAANNRYFNEGSYNTVWWESTVTPLVKLPQRKNFYGENPGALLGDAAAGAAALGFFTSDYYPSYYVLHNTLVQYSFGGLSSGILNASPGALSHELGHNFGLPHANFWQPEGRFPGPTQPPNPQPPFPTDPDSLIGHYDVNAPFSGFNGQTTSEPILHYGNLHDVMGSGPSHFGVIFKRAMNWLPQEFIKTVTASTTNRIYAFDTPRISPGRLYAMRIHKNFQREYWVSYRQDFPDNPWFSNGLELDWLQAGGNVLLDTTPNSTFARQDAALVVGRTFSDPEAKLHITPIALGGGPNPSDKWIDTVVQLGPFPDNQLPTLTLAPEAISVSNGATISFTATAQDPDGDQLAYYWDFGDYTFGSNSAVQTKTFNVDGQFVVRCEVSDMKGGRASANVVILVGTPTTFTISGRVLDIFGLPVQGVRVHNSGLKPNDPEPPTDGITTNSAITDIGTYRYGFTDSQGYYVIGNIPPGVYTNRAFLFGYRTEPFDFTDPVDLNNGNANNLNFIATPITRVNVVRTRDANEPGASEDDDGIFTVSREGGDFSSDLKVRFRVGGTAFVNTDYVLNPIELTTNVVTRTNNGVVRTFTNVVANLVIPAFTSSLDVRVIPFDNTAGNGDKTVILSLLLQTNDIRITTVLTNVLITNGTVVFTNTMFVQRTNQVRIPGWELRAVGPESTLTWFQTDPTYVLDQAEATVTIQDDDPPNLPTVFVTTLDSDALESRGDSATLSFQRFAAPLDSDLVVRYSVSGIASNGVDIVSLPGIVTIPAGQSFVLVPVTALNDLFVEGNEILEVNVLPDPNDLYVAISFNAQVVIVDDDLPVVNIFASDSEVARGAGSGQITFSRAGNLDENLLVNYFVTGTAVSGVDFNTLPGSVIIPAGQLSVAVNITPIAGSVTPLPRTVTVLISDSTTYNIFNQNSATVTIIDSTLPTVTLSAPAATVGENGGTAGFVVTRTGPTTSSLNVLFEVGGSAWEGSDYAAIGTNIVIPAGSASVTINVEPINDSFRELGDETGQETVIVQLRRAANYTLGGTSGRTIRITDDDESNLPAVGFMLRTSTVREDDGTAILYVKVSGNPRTNQPIQVDFRVTSGNAVPNTDYINLFRANTNGGLSTTGVLFITHYEPPDPAPMFFDFENGIYAVEVPLLDDGVVDGDKTLTITLFNPSGFQTNTSRVTNTMTGQVFTNVLITRIPTNAYLGASVTHTLTIQDTKTSFVSVAATATHVYEGQQPARFVVSRTGATNVALTVAYTLIGTAASGNDYVPFSTNGTVTIPAGTNSVTLTLTPLDDPTEEMAESVIFTLIERAGYRLSSPASATVVLVSDDGTIQFSVADCPVREDAGVALVPVLRTGGTNGTTTVDYRFIGGSASNSVDYLGTNGTVTFLPGETIRTISIPLIDDALVETNETILLVLTNATGGVPLGGQKTATVTIVNDDTEFQFAAATFRGNENVSLGEVVIRRNGVLTNSDSVTFTATNGSAGPADFVASSFVVQFLPGESNRTVTVAILDDELFEGDEPVSLSLSNPSVDTQLGALSTASLVIVDDECRIDFERAAYFTIEYSNFVFVVVRRTGGTVNPISVNYVTIDGTAIDGSDYVGTTNTVSFLGDQFIATTNGSGDVVFVPGETTRTISIPIIDDVLGEGNENFSITLSNPVSLNPAALPGATLLGTNATTVVTILDNETPGNVDFEFVAGPNATVRGVALQADLKIVIGGDFTLVDGLSLNRVARLQPDGNLDTSFNPGAGADGLVYAVASQTDGKVIVGGDFTTMNNTNRLRIARLNADGKLDLSFNPGSGVNGIVRAVAVQTNGQVIIAGDFTQVNGVSRNRIARLNDNGTVDSSFTPSLNGTANALAIQLNGQILVAGAFNNANGSARNGLARLNTNGTLDATFVIGSGFNGPIHAVAVHTDGKILAGGAFGNFNTTNINNLVRLNAFGAFDSTFTTGTGPDGAVLSVATANNGRIVIGGAFSNYNAMPRAFFARLTPNGALDSLFNIGTGANGIVRSVVAQENSAILIGGDFTVVNGLPRNHVARVHGDEFLDLVGVEFVASEFLVPEAGGAVATITVQRTGSANRAFNVAYFTATGTATSPDDYLATNGVFSFAVGEMTKTFEIVVFDDALVEGNETVRLFLTNAPPLVQLGALSTATLIILDSARSVYFGASEFSVNEAHTNAFITLIRAGSLEGDVTITLSTSNITAAAGYDYTGFTNLITFTNGESLKIVPLPFVTNDGDPEFTETLLLRLSLGTVGASSPSEAVLSIVDDDPGSGFADIRFNPGAGAGRFVRALALQTDGRLLVGGAFTNFANSNLNFLARLDTNGVVDPSFTPGTGPNALVSGIGLSPDGRIAIGGAFTNYNGQLFNRVVRLTSNGVPDPAFTQPMSFDSAINGLVSQSDGKILVGGAFKVPASGIARIRVTGSIDLQFDPSTGADGPVNAVALQPDGKVLIGGGFSNVAGFPRPRFARLGTNGVLDGTLPALAITNGNVFAIALSPGGKILLGGSFRSVNGMARGGVARLNSDGTLDLSFNPGGGATGTVYTVCALTNGAVFIGGDFTAVNGVARGRYALLRENGSVDPGFDSSIGADNTVFAALVTPDQKIIVGGDFTTIGGVSRRGVARLNVSEQETLRLSDMRVIANSALLRLNSIPGRAYILEGTSNLSYWISLSTNLATGATLDFNDPNVLVNGHRFYRARRFGP